MKERPILFSTEMVRSILDGRKSQTRRIVKPQPESIDHKNHKIIPYNGTNEFLQKYLKCPYGQPGDVLWVRETWSPIEFEDGTHFRYKASFVENNCLNPKWRPSIFMPKEASRIKLKVTNIRVERLQDITGKDAVDEGIEYDDELRGWINYNKYIPSDAFGGNNGSIRSYKSLWESINGKGSWEKNPFVWVIEFKKI